MGIMIIIVPCLLHGHIRRIKMSICVHIHLESCLAQRKCSTNVSYFHYYYSPCWFPGILSSPSLWHMKLSAWSKQYCRVLKEPWDASVLQGKVNLTDASSRWNHLFLVPIVEVLGDILLSEMTFPTLGRRQPCLAHQNALHHLVYLAISYTSFWTQLKSLSLGNPLWASSAFPGGVTIKVYPSLEYELTEGRAGHDLSTGSPVPRTSIGAE